MTVQTSRSEDLVTTVDVRELHGIRWGIMRQMFPKFVEEVELGRYGAVRVEPHHDPGGRPSTHIFHAYRCVEV